MRIIVSKNSTQSPQPSESGYVITFEDLIQEFKTRRIFTRLFRYGNAELQTANIDTLVHPCATAMMLRWLSFWSCHIRDERGRCLSVSLWTLLRLFTRFMLDAVTKKPFLSRVERDIEQLSNSLNIIERNRTLDLSHPPLYLRMDLLYGLTAGGSVGHIAGVLNNLCRSGLNPIFITTDRIPTVDPSIQTHDIVPDSRYWDFLELPSFYFNYGIRKKVLDVLGDRRPSFIYQRYSVNNFSGVKLSQTLGVPLVMEYNGSEVWMSRHWGTPFKYERISASIEDLNLKAADLIVVVSQVMKAELLNQGVDPSKILVNPNGVDPDIYSPEIDGTPIRKQYGLENKIVIGFIGTFGRWHGAELLTETFADLLDKHPEYRDTTRLLLVGDGFTMPKVREIIAKRKLNDFCTLTGLVPQSEGPKYLAACDIAVSPQIPNPDGSPFFGSPTKLFEYMAMGKAITASNLDQIGEVIDHQQTGWLVEPGNPASLMNGLKELIDNPHLRETLGKNARESVIRNYTWGIHAERILEALGGSRSL